MKNKILAIIAILILSVSVGSPAFATESKWNNRPSPLVTTTINGGEQPNTICEELFKGDQNNIFKEVFCSLINISALSIADFATDLTCTIQGTGNSSNYRSDVEFLLEEKTGKCQPNNITLLPQSALTSELITGTTFFNFKTARGIMVVLAVAFLFFLAFASILHININTYSIKRSLPMLLISLIGGFLAIYIVFFFSVVADTLFRLNMFSPNQALHPMWNIFGGYLGPHFATDVTTSAPTGPQNSVNLIFDIGNFLTSGSKTTFISGILGSILLVIPAVAVFAFEYVLALRPFVVQILAVLSPFAFVALVLPQTQFLFRKWWSILLVAIFYAPIANLFFFLLNQIPESSGIGLVSIWALKTAVVVFLVRLPFTFESDLKKIGVRLAQTGFGNSIGLNSIVKTKPQQTKADVNGFSSDKKLEGVKAQKVIVAGKAPIGSIGASRTTKPSVAEPLITNIKDVLRQAHQANLKRTPDLMIRSASDIPPDTIKTILDNSDLRVWRDRRVLNQLKNQNGQVLNEAGVALRADSTRKLARLAEVIDNNKLSNPQAIKFLSQKATLDELPLYILKKAFDEGVINSQDIQNTFGSNTPSVIKRLNEMSAIQSSYVNNKNISKIIDNDHKDYASGFKDLSSSMNEALSSPKAGDSSQTLTKNILSSIKSFDKNAVDQNGLYYLERLGQNSRQSQQEISKSLQSEGIPTQTANAISANPNANLANLSQFLNGKQVSDSTKNTLQRSFMQRDLANSLSTEIASTISEEKTLIQKSITSKLSENISDSKDLKTIKVDVEGALKKITTSSSPEEMQKSIDKINTFYPGAQIKVGQELTDSDIGKTQERGKSILETIDSLMTSSIDGNEVKNNLAGVEKKIAGQVNQTIRKVASGAVASDSAFNAGLENISTPTPKQNG